MKLIIGKAAEPLVFNGGPTLHSIIVFLMGMPLSERGTIKMKRMEVLFSLHGMPLMHNSTLYLMAVRSKIM